MNLYERNKKNIFLRKSEELIKSNEDNEDNE